MEVALCVIGRLENRYASEFVEHYKALGFDHIFILDNNYEGEEHFEDVLGSYISDGYVTVIDVRGAKNLHLESLNYCYNTYGDLYQWMMFVDFDEFLVIGKDIHSFLSAYDDFDCVLVNWMIMTDNGLLTDDGRPCMERFTEPMAYDRCVAYAFPENNHVKCIVKGGKACQFTENPHVPNGNIRYCTANKKPCDQSPFHPYDYSVAYIKHFVTKTAEEWYKNKWVKGVNGTFRRGFASIYKDYFFKVNSKTPEKEAYLNKLKTEYPI